jgi:small subunit ribosomal protein S13
LPNEKEREAKSRGAPKDREGRESKEAKEGKEGKEGKEAKGKKSSPQEKKPVVKRDENFRYIVRLVNTDIDGTKSIVIGLSGVKGVGIRTAEVIARAAGIPRKTKIGDLPEPKTEELEKLINDYSEKVPHWMVNRQSDWSTGADMHMVGVDVELNRRDDINLMKMIRCYKGIRHEQGQKVRGQRTRSNGRTGMTMGVIRKKLEPGAVGEGEKKKE